MKTVFALSSWGNAGVPWIMECINAHPDLHVWACKSGAEHSSISRQMPTIEYLDAIARLGWVGHNTCGDVHGVGTHEYPDLKAAFGEHFKGGHLIGHPVPRLAGSLYFSRELGRDWKHADYLRMWGMDPSDPRAVMALDVLGPDGDHIPAHYINNVNNLQYICGPGGPLEDEPIFKLEDLMTSDAEWARMIGHFSGGAVDYGDVWRRFEGVFIGTAHQPFASGDPRAAWRDLPDYAKRMMVAGLTPESRQAFEFLGYDMSFVC